MQAHRTHVPRISGRKLATFAIAAAAALGLPALAVAPARALEVPPEPLAATTPATASETAAAPDFVLPRITLPVTVDGVLDEEAWRSALVVDRFYELFVKVAYAFRP